ncbi:hypothetical protein MM407_004217 [Salmonella enterica]|nr:hypothetical protein [Salmonella enterica]
MAERISQREQELLEEFLCTVLDDFSKGSITRHQAVSVTNGAKLIHPSG